MIWIKDVIPLVILFAVLLFIVWAGRRGNDQNQG